MTNWIKRDWFGHTLRDRMPLLSLLLAYKLLYFPINRYLADKGGWVADIDAIDGNMPTIPAFVVPYVLSFWLMPMFPLYAAWKFPRPLFQEYMVALFTLMTMGFSFWIAVPAYVEKDPLQGEGFFMDLLKMLHGGDDSYGTHNAIPSSHVYYITLAMCYFIQYDRKLTYPLVAFAVVNAISTMFTRQHYILDVLAGLALAWFAWRLSHNALTPALREWEEKYGVPVSPTPAESSS